MSNGITLIHHLKTMLFSKLPVETLNIFYTDFEYQPKIKD